MSYISVLSKSLRRDGLYHRYLGKEKFACNYTDFLIRGSMLCSLQIPVADAGAYLSNQTGAEEDLGDNEWVHGTGY